MRGSKKYVVIKSHYCRLDIENLITQKKVILFADSINTATTKWENKFSLLFGVAFNILFINLLFPWSIWTVIQKEKYYDDENPIKWRVGVRAKDL